MFVVNAQTFTTFCKRSRRANLQTLPVDGGVDVQRASVHLFKLQWFVSRKHLRPEKPCVKSKCYSHVSSTQRTGPGVLVIESRRLTMQMKLGLLHAVLASLQGLRASAKYQSELESRTRRLRWSSARQKNKIEQMFMLESLRPCQHPVVQPWRVILLATNHPGLSALASALAPSMVCDTLDINHPGMSYLRRA